MNQALRSGFAVHLSSMGRGIVVCRGQPDGPSDPPFLVKLAPNDPVTVVTTMR